MHNVSGSMCESACASVTEQTVHCTIIIIVFSVRHLVVTVVFAFDTFTTCRSVYLSTETS